MSDEFFFFFQFLVGFSVLLLIVNHYSFEFNQSDLLSQQPFPSSEWWPTRAMFIEEIIIDGFKSYATRTVISGFDKQFNAITGLNGSGKSNILDAICFVLGISNLSQVRLD